MIIPNFNTRVKVDKIMTCAYLCVDISRDIDPAGGRKLVFPVYLVLRPYNCRLQH